MDEEVRGFCRAAIAIGATAGVLAAAATVDECREALEYANTSMKTEHATLKSQVARLQRQRSELQASARESEDRSGFRQADYRDLLLEILADDRSISQQEADEFDQLHPGVAGGAVGAYRAHRGSPFFDAVLGLLMVEKEITGAVESANAIAAVYPVGSTRDAARALVLSGSCGPWRQLYLDEQRNRAD